MCSLWCHSLVLFSSKALPKFGSRMTVWTQGVKVVLMMVVVEGVMVYPQILKWNTCLKLEWKRMEHMRLLDMDCNTSYWVEEICALTFEYLFCVQVVVIHCNMEIMKSNSAFVTTGYNTCIVSNYCTVFKNYTLIFYIWYWAGSHIINAWEELHSHNILHTSPTLSSRKWTKGTSLLVDVCTVSGVALPRCVESGGSNEWHVYLFEY